MPRPTQALDLTEEQVLYFRATKTHLAGPGARDLRSAARAMLGAQSQQLAPSLLALSQRTRSRPTAETIRAAILGPRRSLVRTWGQRGTLFVFHPSDWATIVGARSVWNDGRPGPKPESKAIDKALVELLAAEKPRTRKDFVGLAPKSYVRAIADYARNANLEPDHLAAGRLFWCLALRGDACVAEKLGSEQTYAAREQWFPKLDWPAEPIPGAEAATRLTEQYLAGYGPATPQDVAHFFGAKVSTAREWLEALDSKTVPVSCGGRKELLALKKDARRLQEKPPRSQVDWPVRMLPLWDGALMAHADKSWLVPEAKDAARVWRKGAFVAATVIVRGRLVAIWTQKERRGQLEVEVEPLSGWKASLTASVRREAQAVAKHLGLEGAEVSIG